jgi:cytochrome c peroxidase
MRRRLLAVFVAWSLLAVPAGGRPAPDDRVDATAMAEYRAAAADEPLLSEFDDHDDVCPLPKDPPPTRKQRRKLIKLGRKLFRSIDAFGQQPSLGPTVRGQGLSCIGCHGGKGFTDGRNHLVGPTERRDAVVRQTPHLMGIADAAPYGWDGRFACLQAVIKNAIVSPGEMNAAREPTRRQLDSLTAFVETLDAPKAKPGTDYDPELAAQGERLFEDYRGIDVNGDFNAFDGIACIHCHVDPEGVSTDRKFHPILLPPPLLPNGGIDPGHVGENGKVRGFKTPVLRGVRLTAPYFHDGSMGGPGAAQSKEQTIAALLEMMEAYRVRFAFDFTPQEQLAIVHYLLSL